MPRQRGPRKRWWDAPAPLDYCDGTETDSIWSSCDEPAAEVCEIISFTRRSPGGDGSPGAPIYLCAEHVREMASAGKVRRNPRLVAKEQEAFERAKKHLAKIVEKLGA